MSEQYRFIGKPTPRKDAVDIVSGGATFIGDIKIPNLLHVAGRNSYKRQEIEKVEGKKYKRAYDHLLL